MKKIAIYGNCHSPALAEMLDECSSFNRQFEALPVTPVQWASEESQLGFLRDVAPNVDVLVYQPVREDYRDTEIFGAEYVKSHLKGSAVTISFPSLQFYGYQPTSFLCKAVPPELHSFCRKEFGAGGTALLHYDQVARSYLAGRDASEALAAFDEGEDGDDRRAVFRARVSLNHIRGVEQEFGIDLPVSQFIADNYAERLLFHTPRHPGGEVLVLVCRQILQFLSVEVTPREVQRMRSIEPLAETTYPIQRFVGRALNLRFPLATDVKFRVRSLTKEELIKRYYGLYDLFSAEMWHQTGRFADFIGTSPGSDGDRAVGVPADG